jgi:hypothetical protein
MTTKHPKARSGQTLRPETRCPGAEHPDSSTPSRTRTDTVRIFGPQKGIHLNCTGSNISLFATFFVHCRPSESMPDRTYL